MKTARKAMSTVASDSFDWASSHAGDFPESHLGEDVYEDEELIRLMSKAVEELELEWAPPAIPECGSMDKWFLQPGHCRTTSFQRPAPFFLPKYTWRYQRCGTPHIRLVLTSLDQHCSTWSRAPMHGDMKIFPLWRKCWPPTSAQIFSKLSPR